MISDRIRTRIIAEATRKLPTAVGDGTIMVWLKHYVQRGLGYRTIMWIAMGGRDAAEVRGGYRRGDN